VTSIVIDDCKIGLSTMILGLLL